jgi:ABC-type sulfate/molybdate transport systems ATPase subunit
MESRKKNRASSSAEYKVSALRIAEKETVEKPSVADFASAQRRLTCLASTTAHYSKRILLLKDSPPAILHTTINAANVNSVRAD